MKINYYKAEAEKAGLALITELQYLALAHNIASVASNWSGGVVGEGHLFQGLHNFSVVEAQPGHYVSKDVNERRYFELSNGERVFYIAGNCFTWTFDNIQGDEDGMIEVAFTEDSPSITTAPAPSMEKCVGWYPNSGNDWSGRTLVRGGYWFSGRNAGVFFLSSDSPDLGDDCIGFRCTLP